MDSCCNNLRLPDIHPYRSAVYMVYCVRRIMTNEENNSVYSRVLSAVIHDRLRKYLAAVQSRADNGHNSRHRHVSAAASSEAESTVDEEQVKYDTFIAEFFDSNICFADISALVTEAMKGSSFENEIDNSNGVNKITLKGSNGGGMIDVLCIDLSQSNLDHDMEYILENFGDHYFRQTCCSDERYHSGRFCIQLQNDKQRCIKGKISALWRQSRKLTVWCRSSDTRRPMLFLVKTS